MNNPDTQEFIQLTGNLTPKELKDSELVTLHKSLYEKYLKRKMPNLGARAIALKVYDSTINTENIRLYYNRKISIFTPALLTGQLELIIKHSTF